MSGQNLNVFLFLIQDCLFLYFLNILNFSAEYTFSFSLSLSECMSLPRKWLKIRIQGKKGCPHLKVIFCIALFSFLLNLTPQGPVTVEAKPHKV